MMRYLLLSAGLLALSACHTSKVQPTPDQLQKIRFNLSELDEDGLLGPEGGKVAVDYEFCIPRREEYRKEVESIDPSLRIQESSGRIGCGKEEYLCLGNTHQEGFKEVLYRLAQLEYVKRIERAFFE